MVKNGTEFWQNTDARGVHRNRSRQRRRWYRNCFASADVVNVASAMECNSKPTKILVVHSSFVFLNEEVRIRKSNEISESKSSLVIG